MLYSDKGLCVFAGMSVDTALILVELFPVRWVDTAPTGATSAKRAIAIALNITS